MNSPAKPSMQALHLEPVHGSDPGPAAPGREGPTKGRGATPGGQAWGHKVVLASVVVLAALALLVARSHAADAPKPGAAKPALTVALTQAKSSMLSIKLAANGAVAAWQEASVGAEVNGLRVAELHAAVGDKVKRGQLLATFADESVQADVALARAALAETQANAAEAAANADRARAVQDSGAISAQQVNQYLTQEQTAKARVASAKAQLEAQLLRLKNTRLLAPDSGTISARTATVGAVLGAGTEMFKMIRQGRLEWRAEVTSAEIGRITPGTAVLVSAVGGAQMQGRVRTLAPTVDAVTRNGLVYVDLQGEATRPGAEFPAGPPQGKLAPSGLMPAAPSLPAQDGTGRRVDASGIGTSSAVRAATSVGAMFKPGMYARGEFDLGSSSALTVPQTAVVVRDGFSYVVRVGADNRVAPVKVQTGRIVGEQIEIFNGIKPEDKLVASGGGFLSEGDLVHVVPAAAPPAAVANPAIAHAKPAQAASK